MRKLYDRIGAFVCALVLLLAVGVAQAGPYEDALAGFTQGSLSDTGDAIDAVVASGSPRAAEVLEALKDARLMFSAQEKKVYIKGKDDALTDAATGQPVATPPDDIDTVVVNNRLRNIVDAALGGLTLMARDPARRYDAAQAVFKSHEASALAALDKALAQEADARVKRALQQARAAVILYADDASAADKIAAVDVIRERGDQDSLSLLDGLPGTAPADVRRAAQAASARIQKDLAIWSTVQNAWYGLSLGSVLLLAAIGLAITFGVMGVINMAHGEMVMLGAYVTFVVQQLLRAYNPGLLDYSLLLAIPLAFLVSGSVGVLIERGIIRFLYGRPLETLLATWGLSLILQQAVRTAFGPTNREVGNPSWMSGAFEVGYLTITYNRLWIICFTLGVFVALLGLLRLTRLGLEMRAVTQNRAMAAAMGIATSRIDALTFGLGSGIAGLAGVALSLGIANKFLEPFAGAVLGKIAILVLIILFIQKRPRGLFALKGRAVEA